MSLDKDITDKSVETEENLEDKLEEENLEDNVEFDLEDNVEFDLEDNIKKVFKKSEYAYPIIDVVEEFKKLGYSEPGNIITFAIQEELLYVDSIENDGTVYIATVDNEE